MKHLKQMTFPLFKELFDLQDGYRKINEDIAALRNIAWSADKRAVLASEVHDSNLVLGIASLLLCPSKDTGNFIGVLLADQKE